MAVSKKSTRKPKFATGTAVCVRRGVADPDCPAMPLGGWAGRIAEIDQGIPGHTMYLIEWTAETLDSVHVAYRVRCQRAALDETCMWLDENSLEESRGPAVPIDQPTAEAIRSLFEQDDRVKDALESPRASPLPGVSKENLLRYRRYLAERLSFPFEGEDVEADDDGDVTVVALIDSETYDPVDGLLCHCRQQNRPVDVPLRDIEVKHDAANRQLIEDYIYWLGGQTGGEFFEQFPGEVAAGHRHHLEEHAAPTSFEQTPPVVVKEAHAPVDDWSTALAPPEEEVWDLGAPLHRSGSKVGRNDPCPCGSGLKFKKCCLKRP